MLLSAEALGKIKLALTTQLKGIDQELTTLRELEPNDEIAARIKRLENQKESAETGLELISVLLNGALSFERVMEQLKSNWPIIIQLIADYGTGITPLLEDIYRAGIKINELVAEPRAELYAQEAAELKKYYDALVKAGFTEEQAIRIVTSREMPGDLVGTFIKMISIQFKIDVE